MVIAVRPVAVTKSSPLLVGPSAATPAGTVNLTSMDSALSALPMTALFIYERPIHQPAETIKRALSRALVPYYPIAGRLADGADSLNCTGEGVAFLAASASCTLQDSMLLDPPPAIALEDLAATFAAGMYLKEPTPLLLMQVTEFSCGGFVVGVTWNHAVADGVGMAQFLQTVGELARGLSPPSVVPVRYDRFLPELPAPIVTAARSMVSTDPRDYPCSYIRIPMSFINRIKAEFGASVHGSDAAAAWCSTFDVVVAAIWKCRARATVTCSDGQDEPMALAFTVNVRKQAQAKDGYYGNCFSFELAVASRGEVANGDIVDLMKLIRDAKARVPYAFEDKGVHLGGQVISGEDGGDGQLNLDALNGYDGLYVSSWRNLGFDDVDFGAGMPAQVMYNMERKVVPNCFLCGRKAKDAVTAMAFCVREEHAGAFHAELGRLV